MKSHLRYAIPLIIFAVIAVFLFKGMYMNPREIPSPLIGKTVPDFSLPLLDKPGTEITNKDLLGKPYLLNVWATWCVSCRAEHSTLVRLARSGLIDIYGLNWKDDRAGAQTWLRQLGNPYVKTIFDQKGRTAIDLGVYGAPETFLVDSKGVIHYKLAGPVTAEFINGTLMPLLEKMKNEG